jgi:hypothetical protein
MKKIFVFMLAAIASMSLSAQILLTDSSIDDWDNLPAEYVSAAVHQEGCSRDGLKSLKAYANNDDLYLLVEVDWEMITDLSWTPFHVFINTDNSDATGGYGDQWADANTDIMLETAIFADGAPFNYDPAVFKWWGEVGGYGWMWTNPDAEATGENCWGALICEGMGHIGNSQQVGDFIEIQIEYGRIPAEWNAEQFSVGVDIQQSWNSVGVLPNAPENEWGEIQLAEKLVVNIDSEAKSSRFEVDGLWYTITSEEGATVSLMHERNAEYNYANLTEAVIPASVVYEDKSYAVTGILGGALANCALNKMVIPASVISIADEALQDSYILKNGLINFSPCTSENNWGLAYFVDQIVDQMYIVGDTLVGAHAAIVEANIPEGVKHIRSYALSGKHQLEVVDLPESLKNIEFMAFYQCQNLSSVTGGEHVDSIGGSAFVSCSQLYNFTIPSSVKYIGYRIFGETPIEWYGQWENGMLYKDGCLLQSNSGDVSGDVVVADGTRLIADQALIYCENMTGITIPSSVEHIGNEALYGCMMLASKLINHSQCTSEDYWGATIIEQEVDGLYISNNIVVGARKDIREANIPEGVVGIAEYALQSCYELQRVSMPSTLERIGYAAFSYCSNLRIISIPGSVKYIGGWAFERCEQLSSVTLAEGVDSIEYCAFYNCSNLQSIKLPKSVKYISSGVFEYCYGLSEVVLSEGLDSIAQSAFYGCENLYYITIPSTVNHIGSNAFGSTNMQHVTFKGDVPPVMEEDVWGWEHYREMLWTVPCGALEAYQSLDILNTYYNISIEDACIGGECGDDLRWTYDEDTQELAITGTGEMYDYDTWTPWGEYVYAISSIQLNEGITYIGTYAFYNCKYVESIEIPVSVKTIGDNAFEECRKLSEIRFAEGGALTKVGNWAFYKCHKLSQMSIPEGVEQIGYGAFYACSNLKEISMPSTLEWIGDNALTDCVKLEKMHVKALVPPTADPGSFDNVDRMIPVIVPETSVAAYKAAPVWEEFNIQAYNPTLDVDNLGADNGYKDGKVLRDGQLIIIRNGKEYNMLGAEL